jgi:hypothetical protein
MPSAGDRMRRSPGEKEEQMRKGFFLASAAAIAAMAGAAYAAIPDDNTIHGCHASLTRWRNRVCSCGQRSRPLTSAPSRVRCPIWCG